MYRLTKQTAVAYVLVVKFAYRGSDGIIGDEFGRFY